MVIRKKKRDLEYIEQCTLVEYLTLNKIFHFAVVNENNMSFANRQKAKAIENKHQLAGKVKGTSDMVVLLPNKLLFIEMKRQKHLLKSGKLSSAGITFSEEQKEFLNIANTYPYVYGKVCYGCKEAIEFIEACKKDSPLIETYEYKETTKKKNPLRKAKIIAKGANKENTKAPF